MNYRLFYNLIPIFLFLVNISCVQESPIPVAFDQELESVTFENQLLTPIIIFRDGAVLDTLSARTTRRYPINRKGLIRHAWRILAPRDGLGRVLGVEPYVDLGVQYEINAEHTISNTSADRTLFTPRIANLTFDRVRLFYVNYREQDEFLVNKVFDPSESSSIEHAAYYYWNTYSNVYLDNLDRPRIYEFSRNDTLFGGYPELDLSNDSEYRGSGVTEAIIIQ